MKTVKTGISEFLDMVIGKFTKAAISQEQKGLEKYGHAVQPHDPKWDWLNMAEEELIDAYKYLVADRIRRDDVLAYATRELNRIATDLEGLCPANNKSAKDIRDIVASLKKISKNV